ncbi:MAG: 4-hydroxybenzoate octaprenyltransferase [Acidobacteria bacterium RIFCSPLOWO2_02_FULL_61_28]|nr:MAG: 4-hydroxybenzoate octaprenyltransferase [Acidobacteria bacterium RIFCSPLOWO2_02_FULL_61_28]
MQNDGSGFALWQRIGITLEMIKIEHSVFALPFALIGALLAARGWPSGRQLLWIVVAMIGARSAAMSFNRLIDRSLDAQNPRTAQRALPAGLLSARFVTGFALLSSAVLVVAANQLNPLAFRLSPVALAILFVYSYTKRFTVLSHLVLGFCLGIAPAAAWIAIRGTLAPSILLLTAAVTLWTAGFDILYACQDVDFDRRIGLHSIPQRWGIARALQVSAAMHGLMVVLLLWLAWVEQLGWISVAGVAVVGTLLVYEHRLIKPFDLSRLDAAFFNTNGWIGILLLLFWGFDIVTHSG